MAAPLSRTGDPSSLMDPLVSEKDQKPSVEIGAPFDRDGVRWTPISINTAGEVATMEASFLRPDEFDSIPNKVQSTDFSGLECVAVSSPGSYQIILCAPLGNKVRQIPKSFLDFQQLAKDMINIFDNSVVNVDLERVLMEGKKETLPNNTLFGLQIHIKPIMAGETVSREGSFILIYATKNAIYLLADKNDDGVLHEQNEAFFSSFTVK